MSMIVKGEGLIRLEAERLLLRRLKDEYQRLKDETGHIGAVKTLVARRKRDYDECIREARTFVQRDAVAA
jgi:hypothetical protein